MEEDKNEQTETQTPVQTQAPASQQSDSNGVSFPTVGSSPKKGGGKTLLVVIALIIIAVLGYIIFRSSSKKSGSDISGVNPVETTSPEVTTESSPTASPKAVDKSAVKIQIQNGTGITGEAGYLQTQLKALGYTNITAGNASTQDASAATVTFSKSLGQSAVDEITKKLESIYTTVTAKTSTTQTTDVVIITGLRKGATAKPSASPVSSATPKPSASASSSPTATSTTAPTSTP